MATPVGRPCAQCTAVLVARQQTAVPARHGRHRWHGWLWRILHPGRSAEAAARWRP
ncbi:MAG: hypothetical protein JO115_22670 [Pseudonocardiales bacterium]|nr:hypothetical protein [Pseudonocardiales bacterium]